VLADDKGSIETAQPDFGSFRDYESRVFRCGDGIFRALSPIALEDFQAVSATPFFGEAQASGALVGTRIAEGVEAPVAAQPILGVAAVLQHERIPFLSWPYEWPFSMLKAAALSQLELLREALAHGLVLKDGTPYNTQWRGAEPVFIDVGSIERVRDGEPWAGYRQFCMQFLYPLMLQSFRDVAFQPLLRGRLAGIPPDEMRRLLTGRDRLRRGVATHVVLHARLERRHRSGSSEGARRELREAGFRPELIAANVRRLIRLIRGLTWDAVDSGWADYGDTHGYSPELLARKEAFVGRAAERAQASLAWDLGCNDGRFSRIAAQHTDYVVAVDADQLLVDRLYRELHVQGETKILALVMDLVDASPNLGWRGSERGALTERGAPDLVLALALVHHVVIGGNVPIDDFLGWLADLGSRLVIEFPERDDPRVQQLLSGKRAGAHPDYHLERFEMALGARFDILERERIGSRLLYEARPR